MELSRFIGTIFPLLSSDLRPCRNVWDLSRRPSGILATWKIDFEITSLAALVNGSSTRWRLKHLKPVGNKCPKSSKAKPILPVILG